MNDESKEGIASRLSLAGLMDLPGESIEPRDIGSAEKAVELGDAEDASPNTEIEARHAEFLISQRAAVEELSELYATAHGKQLEHLMRQVRQRAEVPGWVLLSMTQRMMRATESEQCDILNAMANTGHDEIVCLVCRELHDKTSPRHELAITSTLGQLGDRRDYHLLSRKLEKRHASQELKIAIKRALIQIEKRHPESKLTMSAGGLTMRDPAAEEGALTLQQDGVEEEDSGLLSQGAVENELRELLQNRSLELIALPAPRRSATALLERQEYDWLELSQGPHELKGSVLFALSVHEIVKWPAGVLVILFVLPFVLGAVVFLATKFLLAAPILLTLFFGYLRQRRQHYSRIFDRGELFLADVSFPDGGERAALELTSREHSQRPPLRRHVRLSRRLARHYKAQPELRGVALWDEEGGGMLMLDDLGFLAINERGEIVVRRTSSVIPGMIMSSVMVAIAAILTIVILAMTFMRSMFW